MKILCVIPARIGSTRLARKPLILLGGKPMVQRTYEAAIQCREFSKVVVATDDAEIAAVITSCGGHIEMTSADIQTGSDRAAVVAQRYPEMEVIFNLQGDEPFMKPHMLSTLAQPYLQGLNPPMATLAYPLDFEKKYTNPGIVKVVLDQNNFALYFSRAPIPYFRNPMTDKTPVLNHMGTYAFTREFLQIYTQLEQTPLEMAESLEQLRALENGYRIYVCKVNEPTLEINTPEELAMAQAFF